jgi:Uma2 family endonuclease
MNTLMAGAPRKHLISVEEYYRMAEAGLLAPDARVELIAGEIIDMVPIGSRHARAVAHLHQQFVLAAGDRALVRSQCPVRLDYRSEPEPDLALLRPRADEYSDSHPEPADTLLIVEVSDSSLEYDRDIKLALYAQHGIREAWIVDLKHDELLICRSPCEDRYIECSSTQAPGLATVASLPGMQVNLSRLFHP